MYALCTSVDNGSLLLALLFERKICIMHPLLSIDFDGYRDGLRHENCVRADERFMEVCDSYYPRMDAGEVYNGLDSGARMRIRRKLLLFGCANDDAAIVEGFKHYLDAGDPVLARPLFMVSDTRQCWQEKLQFDVLSTQSQVVNNWENPSNKDGASLPMAKKTIDFTGTAVGGTTGEEYRVYMAAKYTQSEGGAQDNQCNDLMSFADTARYWNTSGDDGHGIIVLIADGEYYSRPRAKFSNRNFYEHVRHAYHDECERNLVATDTKHFDRNLDALMAKL